MRHGKTTGMTLLGGALLGAAAWYFLDPRNGPARRRQVGAWAGDALGCARNFGGELGDRAREWRDDMGERAHDAAASVSAGWEHARDAAGNVRPMASLSWLGHKISDAAHGAWDRATRWGHTAADSAREATHSVRHRLARAIDSDVDSSGSHVAGYSAVGIGTLVAGAAAMYFLDPQQGAERRTQVSGQFFRIVGETGTAFRRIGRSCMNTLRGRRDASDEMESSYGDDISGERLLQRCRACVSRTISRPTDVQLMADAGGAVTLYGVVSSDEVDLLIAALQEVEGVNGVVNRLEPQTPNAWAPGTAASSAPLM